MKNILMILIMIIAFTAMAINCERESRNSINCVKGTFIGTYCEGYVIKILDQSNLGKNWKAMYGTEIYENSVVASIDSIYIKTVQNADKYFSQGSVFYFKYIPGGYPRKQYNICEPAPFITINFLSLTPCPDYQ